MTLSTKSTLLLMKNKQPITRAVSQDVGGGGKLLCGDLEHGLQSRLCSQLCHVLARNSLTSLTLSFFLCIMEMMKMMMVLFTTASYYEARVHKPEKRISSAACT